VFTENGTFFPENGKLKVRTGQAASIPELKYYFPAGHKHQFNLTSRHRKDGRGREIVSYWIEVRADVDFDDNGRTDRIRFTTLYRDDKRISYRAFRQFR